MDHTPVLACLLNEYGEAFSKEKYNAESLQLRDILGNLSNELGVIAFLMYLNESPPEQSIPKILHLCDKLESYNYYKEQVEKIKQIFDIYQIRSLIINTRSNSQKLRDFKARADSFNEYHEKLFTSDKCKNS